MSNCRHALLMAESGRKGGERERIRTARCTPTGGVMHESRERKGKMARGGEQGLLGLSF